MVATSRLTLPQRQRPRASNWALLHQLHTRYAWFGCKTLLWYIGNKKMISKRAWVFPPSLFARIRPTFPFLGSFASYEARTAQLQYDDPGLSFASWLASREDHRHQYYELKCGVCLAQLPLWLPVLFFFVQRYLMAFDETRDPGDAIQRHRNHRLEPRQNFWGIFQDSDLESE